MGQYTAYETETRRPVAMGDYEAISRVVVGLEQTDIDWAIEEAGQCDTGKHTIVTSDTKPEDIDWAWTPEGEETEKP